MNEEFSGDEFLLLGVSVFVTFAGVATWYAPVARVPVLGRPRSHRPVLFSVPLVCLGLIWVALARFAAAEVRNSVDYLILFLVAGAAWLTIAGWLFSLLGVSFREDALEQDNPAAAVVICGAMVAVALTYAGANIGEGPTVWTTLYSALIATGWLLVLWLTVELTTDISVAVTVDRDMASGVRLAGLLISLGLICGRAVAGDWESAPATWRDFARDAWPTILWVLAAVVVEVVLRPGPQRPFPSLVRCGVAPALLYLLAAAGYAWRLGPWNTGAK